MAHLVAILAAALLAAQDPKPETESQIRAALEKLSRAMSGDEKESFADRFSFPRMVKELEAQGALKGLSEGDEARKLFIERLKATFPTMARTMASMGGAWEKIRMLHLKLQSGGEEAETFCHVTIAGSRTRFRFWLAREGEDWKLFDYEMLDGGMRLSATVAALSASMSRDAETRTAMQKMFAALIAGIQHVAAGEVDQARASCAGARQAKPPGRIHAWIDLFDAHALAYQAKFEEAIQAADRALDVQKDLALAHHLKATAYAALDESEKAIASEKEYMRFVGDDTEAWLAIGEAYEKLGKPAEAIEAFRKGTAFDDEDFSCRMNLGRLLVGEGKAVEAKPHLLAASRIASPGEGVFEEAAEALSGSGEHAAVLELAEEGGKRTPDDETVRLWQGRARRRRSRLGEAEKVLRRAALKEKEKDEESSECAEELVFALAQAGKHQEALERAGFLAVGQGDSARYVRLFLHAMAGRAQKGVEELRALLEEDDEVVDRILKEPAFEKFRLDAEVRKVLDPARAKRDFHQAVQKRMKGDWEGMLKLSLERAAVVPDDPLTLYFQGYALRRLRRFEEAAKALRGAVQKGKETRDPREELGRALAALGKVDEALAEPDALMAESKARGLALRVAIYAIAGKTDLAISALRELLKEDRQWHEVVRKDTDLEEFRKLPAVLEQLKRAKEEE
jgi:tetratricopeptide (TPR) repeat protein